MDKTPVEGSASGLPKFVTNKSFKYQILRRLFQSPRQTVYANVCALVSERRTIVRNDQRALPNLNQPRFPVLDAPDRVAPCGWTVVRHPGSCRAEPDN